MQTAKWLQAMKLQLNLITIPPAASVSLSHALYACSAPLKAGKQRGPLVSLGFPSDSILLASASPKKSMGTSSPPPRLSLGPWPFIQSHIEDAQQPRQARQDTSQPSGGHGAAGASRARALPTAQYFLIPVPHYPDPHYQNRRLSTVQNAEPMFQTLPLSTWKRCRAAAVFACIRQKSGKIGSIF
jgi:hypothetical protein